jgi:hypothetical protein
VLSEAVKHRTVGQGPQIAGLELHFHGRAEQRSQLLLGAVTRRKIVRAFPPSHCRMAINFGYPVWQVIENPEDAGLDHRAAVIQTEQMIVRWYAYGGELTSHPSCLRKVEKPACEAPEDAIAVCSKGCTEGLERDPHRGGTKARSDLRYGRQDDRMHVEVLVSIDVVHLKPRSVKTAKLRVDLGIGLAAQLW